VKHPLGKGNQFCINEGAGPPGARGARPNRENKGISFKATPQEWLNRM